MKLFVQEGSRSKFFLNFTVLVIALLSFTNREYKLERTSTFERIMVETYAPIQQGVAYLQRKSSSLIDHYVKNIYASQKNEELQKQIKKMEKKVFELQEIELENQRLKELLDFGRVLSQKKVLAQIVAWDASSDFKVLRINKGKKHGIRLQSTVVTSDGLVGYIYRLTNHYADVLTIIDSNNRVDGLIKRTRAHGILEGYSGNKMIMKYVKRTEPVILGDIALTSGLGNVYPKGIRVGKVTRIERQSYGITQHIEVTPAVDFGQVEEVVVLVSPNNPIQQKEWKALDNPVSSQGSEE